MSANTSACGQARAPLEASTLEDLQDQSARAAGKQRAARALMVWPPGPRRRRHHLLDARHGPKSGPLPSAERPKAGCGLPMPKVVGLFSLASGAPLRAVHGPVRLSEVPLFGQLWPHLSPGEVVLADRGFCSFGCLAALQQLGVESVLGPHQARCLNWRGGQRLGKADRLVVWSKPGRCPRRLSAEAFAALPVRQVRLQAPPQRLPHPHFGRGDDADRPHRLPAGSPGRPLLATRRRGVALPGTRKRWCAWASYAAARRS